MTAKEYLSKIQANKRIIQSYADRIKELRHEATGLKAITYDKDRVQTSPENRLEKIFEAIYAIEEEYARDKVKYETEARKITTQIKNMEKPLHAELLHFVYVDGLSLRLAAAKIQVNHPDKVYGEDYIRQVHGWALDAFDQKYKISTKYNQI